MIIAVVGVLTLVVWVTLLVGRGGFWRVSERFENLDFREPGKGWPSVTAITPARNEAALLKETLPRLLGQNYPGRFTIAVVDDQSSDATALIAQRLMRGNPRATLVDGAAPPSGWTGKLWALQQGLSWADETERSDYLLLVDADIVLMPDVLRRLFRLRRSAGRSSCP